MPTCDLIQGDCLDVLPTLPERSVHMVCTSPPYYGLRDYGCEGQLGLEPTPDAYVARLVEVMRQVKRVLRDDATLWLVLGDSYGSGETGRVDGAGPGRSLGQVQPARADRRLKQRTGLSSKQLLGIPWRVAFALQADGWLLRSDVIWHKPNPMPESVRDRPTTAHEHVFLLAKQARYFYDADAVSEPAIRAGCLPSGQRYVKQGDSDDWERRISAAHGITPVAARRNRRSVWTVATRPYKGAHFATFPPALIEPCILAGTSAKGCCSGCGAPWVRVVERESYSDRPIARPIGTRGNQPSLCVSPGDLQQGGRFVTVKTLGWQPSCRCPSADPVPSTVLDPFAGAGTTGLVTLQHGRNFIGIDLNSAYLGLARQRLAPLLAQPLPA